MRTTLHALAQNARHLLTELHHSWLGRHLSQTANRRSPPPGPTKYQPIRQVILTDEVGRTLFEEYAAHRESSRGHEETGWVLLGLREVSQAIVLASAGAKPRPRARYVTIEDQND